MNAVFADTFFYLALPPNVETDLARLRPDQFRDLRPRRLDHALEL